MVKRWQSAAWIKRWQSAAWIAVLAGAVLAAGTGPAAAEPVPVRAAAHKDFGRIVFKWPTPGPYSATVSGDRLVVQFGRPIEANLGPVVRSLRKYLRNGAAGADGTSVTFTLKGDFNVRSFDSGAAVVVDVLDKSPGTAEAPAGPTQKTTAAPANTALSANAPAKGGGAGPRIKVRTGLHKDYTRLVFDWPAKVDYSFQQSGGTVTVRFQRAAQLNVAALNRQRPGFLKGISASPDGDGVRVTLRVGETSRVRHFLSGPKVVVDVLAPGTPKQAAKSAPARKQPVRTADAPASPAAPKKAAPKEPVKAAAKTRNKTAPAPAGGPKPLALTPPGGGAPGPAATAKPGPQPAGGPPGETRTPKGPAQVTAAPVGRAGSGIALNFNWDEPVAAAVFRRAGYLWVAFDKKIQLDVASLKAAGGNVLRAIEQVPAEKATVLRMTTVAGINPTLRRNGLTWIMEFKKQGLVTKTAIQANAQPNSPVGARIFLSVPEPGDAIVIKDPEVGDNLIAVPVLPLGYGVVRNYIYPQAQILPSIQGVVVRPWVDDLRVRPLRSGIEITAGSGLQISRVTAAAAAAARGGGRTIRELIRVFDLKKWKKGTIQSFYRNKKRLQNAVARNPKGMAREDARMDLARFYFANAFGAEALGVLRVAGEARADLAKDPEFHALRGASKYLMGRYSEALGDMMHPSLNKNDEGTFWRAAVQAAMGRRVDASLNLRRFGAIIRPYPPALKFPLSLLIAESAIDVGDIRSGKRYLDQAGAEKLNKAQQAQHDFVSGRLLELAGKFDDAVAKWETAAAGPHRPSRAKAAVARAELLLKLRQMSRREAAQELEKLRFSWRGDDFEFALLRRLGRLYMDDENYRDGLRILRNAATYFRTNPKAKEVTQEMATAFIDLYLKGAADQLEPMTAIALFEEFKELTPVGATGDEMIRKLADRLVAVDLLGNGAKLLEKQVRFRLKGVDKARVGARLALVHLMDRKFERSVQVLTETNADGLPESLIVQRRHLKARALVGLALGSEALELLKKDKSVDANLLRVELFWNTKDWSNAAQVLRRLLRQYRAKADKPLDDRQGRQVLNLAIALTLSGNERAVDKLRTDFGKAMAVTPFGDAFRLIATPQSAGLIDYRTITGKVKDAENFQTFMAAYMGRLKKQNLSGIN